MQGLYKFRFNTERGEGSGVIFATPGGKLYGGDTGSSFVGRFTEAVAFVNQARKTLARSPGEDSLHSGEWSILRILEQAGACTVPQIARARSTSRQNVQIIINRLSAAGQVEFR